MQQTDSSLTATKMDDNAEGRAKGTYHLNTQRKNSCLRVVKTDGMPRVVPGKKGSLDIQRTAMQIVVLKTTPAHSGKTSV